MESVLTELQGAVLKVTLYRPETRNAIDDELITGLTDALSRAGEDQGVGAVVLTGGSGRFCSGLNLKHVAGLNQAAGEAFLGRVMGMFQMVATCAKPVIAMIDGPALAGGFDLAVMCDIRYASIRARFGQPEILIGFTQLIDPLWKIIGLGRARELALTGRIYEAREAHSIGLVSSVYTPHELVERTMNAAADLAGRSRRAVAATRRMCREVPGAPLERALEDQGRVFLDLFNQPDTPARVRAFLESVKK